MKENNETRKDNVKQFIKETVYDLKGIALIALTGFVGYKVGYTICGLKTDLGLQVIFKEDPELERRMRELIEKEKCK